MARKEVVIKMSEIARDLRGIKQGLCGMDVEDGGEGSGNYEHKGRPGEIGGSGPGGGGSSEASRKSEFAGEMHKEFSGSGASKKLPVGSAKSYQQQAKRAGESMPSWANNPRPRAQRPEIQALEKRMDDAPGGTAFESTGLYMGKSATVKYKKDEKGGLWSAQKFQDGKMVQRATSSLPQELSQDIYESGGDVGGEAGSKEPTSPYAEERTRILGKGTQKEVEAYERREGMGSGTSKFQGPVGKPDPGIASEEPDPMATWGVSNNWKTEGTANPEPKASSPKPMDNDEFEAWGEDLYKDVRKEKPSIQIPPEQFQRLSTEQVKSLKDYLYTEHYHAKLPDASSAGQGGIEFTRLITTPSKYKGVPPSQPGPAAKEKTMSYPEFLEHPAVKKALAGMESQEKEQPNPQGRHEKIAEIRKSMGTPYERTKAGVYATGNKWAIENWEGTHN